MRNSGMLSKGCDSASNHRWRVRLWRESDEWQHVKATAANRSSLNHCASRSADIPIYPLSHWSKLAFMRLPFMQFIAVLNKAPSVYNQMLFPSTSNCTLTLPQQRMVEEKDTAGRKKKNRVPCLGPTLTIFRRNCGDNPAKSHIAVLYSQTNYNQYWLTDKILPWIKQDVMPSSSLAWRDGQN